MKYRVVLTPDANADISSVVRWYQLIDLNLASRFISETRAIQRRIAHFPYQFPLIDGSIRRAIVTRFPYSIFLSLNKNSASVIAVVHQRRSDTIWRARA